MDYYSRYAAHANPTHCETSPPALLPWLCGVDPWVGGPVGVLRGLSGLKVVWLFKILLLLLGVCSDLMSGMAQSAPFSHATLVSEDMTVPMNSSSSSSSNGDAYGSWPPGLVDSSMAMYANGNLWNPSHQQHQQQQQQYTCCGLVLADWHEMELHAEQCHDSTWLQAQQQPQQHQHYPIYYYSQHQQQINYTLSAAGTATTAAPAPRRGKLNAAETARRLSIDLMGGYSNDDESSPMTTTASSDYFISTAPSTPSSSSTAAVTRTQSSPAMLPTSAPKAPVQKASKPGKTTKTKSAPTGLTVSPTAAIPNLLFVPMFTTTAPSGGVRPIRPAPPQPPTVDPSTKNSTAVSRRRLSGLSSSASASPNIQPISPPHSLPTSPLLTEEASARKKKQYHDAQQQSMMMTPPASLPESPPTHQSQSQSQSQLRRHSGPYAYHQQMQQQQQHQPQFDTSYYHPQQQQQHQQHPQQHYQEIPMYSAGFDASHAPEYAGGILAAPQQHTYYYNENDGSGEYDPSDGSSNFVNTNMGPGISYDPQQQQAEYVYRMHLEAQAKLLRKHSAPAMLVTSTSTSGSSPPVTFVDESPSAGTQPGSPTQQQLQLQQFHMHQHQIQQQHEAAAAANSLDFRCTLPGCDKGYKNANGLRYHIRHGHQLKSEDKPYKCAEPNCGRSYKNANGLKYHRIHGHPPAPNDDPSAILGNSNGDNNVVGESLVNVDAM